MKNIASIILSLIAIAHISSATAQSDNLKPNIVYILADDLGYGDLSSYGQTKFTTPNIDALAAKGIKFTQHYSGSTVCAPSRSALITGQHTGHTTVRGNFEIQPEGQFPIRDADFTIAELLKSAGYVTGAFGKWGLGPVGSTGDPNSQGFDEFYGYNCQRLSHSYYPYHLWDNNTKVVLDDNSGAEKGVYAPNIIHQKALEFIDANKDKPFFLFYPSTIPHAELAAPEEYMEKFRDKFAPDKAYKGVDAGPKFKNGGYSSQPETRAAFAAMVTLLDDEVGEIVAKLEELGLTDNTLIIFTSDNGAHKEGGADPQFFNSSGDLKGFKRDLYEGGIRVPMVARWDGKIAQGFETDHISAFWDLMPTLSDLTGAQIPEPNSTDGISFLPTLLGENQPEHEFLYWEFAIQGGKQAVRMGKWKAVRTNANKGMNSPIELYDLSTDIGEKRNLASQFPAVADSMARIMISAHEESAKFPFDFEEKR